MVSAPPSAPTLESRTVGPPPSHHRHGHLSRGCQHLHPVPVPLGESGPANGWSWSSVRGASHRRITTPAGSRAEGTVQTQDEGVDGTWRSSEPSSTRTTRAAKPPCRDVWPERLALTFLSDDTVPVGGLPVLAAHAPGGLGPWHSSAMGAGRLLLRGLRWCRFPPNTLCLPASLPACLPRGTVRQLRTTATQQVRDESAT